MIPILAGVSVFQGPTVRQILYLLYPMAFVAESFFVRHGVYLMGTTHYMLYNVRWGLLSVGAIKTEGKQMKGLNRRLRLGFLVSRVRLSRWRRVKSEGEDEEYCSGSPREI